MKTSIKETALLGVTDALRLVPFSLAVGVCSGFGILGGCITAILCILCGALFGFAFLPSWITLLPVFMAAFRYGSGAGAVTVLAGGVFAFLLSLIPEEKRRLLFNPAVYSGFLLAAAFTTTALQTTNYFGIGAVGGTTVEIIRDYVSLGFHGNWRGVLYGTIVMVVLICYPRAFKQLKDKLPAVFVALLITFPLHLLLVPHAEGSPVNEIGSFAFRDLLNGAFFKGNVPIEAIPSILCGGLSLALLMTKDLVEGPMRGLSVASLCSGVLGGVPVSTDGTPRPRLSALFTALVTAALYCIPGLSRMTVHSLAVILIVIAWQSVQWGQVKQSFTGGARSVGLFVFAVALTIVAGVHYAVPLLVALSVLFAKKDE